MKHHSIVGLDIAKSVFQVHRTDRSGAVLERRSLRRGALLAYFAKLPPSLIGLEACAGAHHWARSLQALGHEVRLIAIVRIYPDLLVILQKGLPVVAKNIRLLAK